MVGTRPRLGFAMGDIAARGDPCVGATVGEVEVHVAAINPIDWELVTKLGADQFVDYSRSGEANGKVVVNVR